MKKLTIILGLAIVLGFIISLSGIRISDSMMSTFYNLYGIMFSIGMGLIISFSYDGVYNKDFIQVIRDNIKHTRNHFIFNFTIFTIFYILNEFITYIIIRDITFIYAILSIIYVIVNFLAIQNLHDQIHDKIIKEKNNY